LELKRPSLPLSIRKTSFQSLQKLHDLVRHPPKRIHQIAERLLKIFNNPSESIFRVVEELSKKKCDDDYSVHKDGKKSDDDLNNSFSGDNNKLDKNDNSMDNDIDFRYHFPKDAGVKSIVPKSLFTPKIYSINNTSSLSINSLGNNNNPITMDINSNERKLEEESVHPDWLSNLSIYLPRMEVLRNSYPFRKSGKFPVLSTQSIFSISFFKPLCILFDDLSSSYSGMYASRRLLDYANTHDFVRLYSKKVFMFSPFFFKPYNDEIRNVEKRLRKARTPRDTMSVEVKFSFLFHFFFYLVFFFFLLYYMCYIILFNICSWKKISEVYISVSSLLPDFIKRSRNKQIKEAMSRVDEKFDLHLKNECRRLEMFNKEGRSCRNGTVERKNGRMNSGVRRDKHKSERRLNSKGREGGAVHDENSTCSSITERRSSIQNDICVLLCEYNSIPFCDSDPSLVYSQYSYCEPPSVKARLHRINNLEEEELPHSLYCLGGGVGKSVVNNNNSSVEGSTPFSSFPSSDSSHSFLNPYNFPNYVPCSLYRPYTFTDSFRIPYTLQRFKNFYIPPIDDQQQSNTKCDIYVFVFYVVFFISYVFFFFFFFFC
jgi:hypothetical protein